MQHMYKHMYKTAGTRVQTSNLNCKVGVLLLASSPSFDRLCRLKTNPDELLYVETKVKTYKTFGKKK